MLHGSLSRRARATAFGLVAMTLMITTLAPSDAAGARSPRTPTLSASPTSTVAGTSIAVSGRGFSKRQQGTIALGANLASVSFAADASGSFSVRLSIPRTVPLGTQGVAARAAITNALLAQTSIALMAPSPAPTIPPTTAPTAGPTVTPTSVPTSVPTTAPTVRPSAAPTAAPTTAPTPKPTVIPTAGPTVAPTPAPTATAAPSRSLRWGLIGNDGTHLAAERSAGINTKLLELGWSTYEPSQGAFSTTYINQKRSELAAMRSAGFSVILSFGVQYSPSWLLSLPNARYVNQYGDAYADTSSGSGQANVIWNPTIRSAMATYMARVFADLGTDFDAVRIGGGRYGELGYPVATYNGKSNTYWAFDANAAASNPVPGWKPGMAGPNGEAGKFLEWYLAKLNEYQGWQIATVRRSYAGRIIVLHPSFGIRPGQAAAAVAKNLGGTTSPEVNGEIQRGYDYARLVGSVRDTNVLIASTWLNSPYGDDASTDPGKRSPIGYLTYLAGQQGLKTYGENTGRDTVGDMDFTNAQAMKFGLQGFVWFNESELFSGAYATLSDYSSLISRYR